MAPDPNKQPPPGMVTTAAAAAETGVSPSTIYRWATTGRIPAVRTVYGRRLFVRIDDVRRAYEPVPVEPQGVAS